MIKQYEELIDQLISVTPIQGETKIGKMTDFYDGYALLNPSMGTTYTTDYPEVNLNSKDIPDRVMIVGAASITL